MPGPNTDFIAVAGGAHHSFGVKSDGSIVGWGRNTSGQTNILSPNTGFVAVAGGDNHSIGVKGDDCDPCDMNCDGRLDAFDIAPFLDLLFEGTEPCCGMRGEVGSTGDVNGDGTIDAFDIEPFLECLFP